MSSLPPLVDPGRIEIKLDRYGVAPATALSDGTILPRVQDYRRRTGTRMYPMDPNDIRRRLPSGEYFVSRKFDGEFIVLVYRDGQAVALNAVGTVFVGLPWLTEAAEQLQSAGLTQAIIAGEHHMKFADRRCQVHDVLAVTQQPTSQDKLEQLQFAAFDILDLNGELPPIEFAETWSKLEALLGGGERAVPCLCRLLHRLQPQPPSAFAT